METLYQFYIQGWATSGFYLNSVFFFYFSGWKILHFSGNSRLISSLQVFFFLSLCPSLYITVTETTSNNQEMYIGLTGNEFKTRFNLHKSSFKLEHKRTSTTLSDHVWKLKKKNINFNITWQVVKRVKPFAPSNKVCELCLQEKLSILRSAPSLNKRNKIFEHCIHRKKFLLSNLSMSTDEVSNADRNSES